MGNRHKFIGPKNHPVLNIIGNMDDFMVTMRQSKQNEIGFFCYFF